MSQKVRFETESSTAGFPGQVIHAVYFHNDIRIICKTNHPTLAALLQSMLGMFPEPTEKRGEATYSIFCNESVTDFPVQLPDKRVRTETLHLLTGTTLKFYRGNDASTDYQWYRSHSGVNKAALSVIQGNQHAALTQLGPLECYDIPFLRRYVLLLALGALLRTYGLEPCHAAAITLPGDDQQGVLILGESGSGKTTLSLGCAVTGCGLLGDDLVLLGNNSQRGGTISAYAIMPEVSVRSASLELWQSLAFLQAYPADLRDKRYCTIEQIRPGSQRFETTIRALVFPSLSDDTETSMQPLSKVATLQALITHCISKEGMYQQTQERLFSLLAALAEQAPGYQFTVARGDSNSPQRLCSLLARSGVC